MSQPTIHLLTLLDDGSPDIVGNYINLPPPTQPYTLRFAIQGASSICREGSLWVNVPAAGEEFQRNKFRKFDLTPHFNRTIYVDVTIDRPGAFAYYVAYSPSPPFTASSNSSEEAHRPTQTSTYYFTVPPNLTINGQPIPLDSLSIISVVSKWLGPVSEWAPHLSYISRKGYNMIHFTPIQQRGDSNSPYSLANHLAFDPEAFPNGQQDVVKVIGDMEKEYGILSLTDVVWNHTAPNSEWLAEHPESGYNLATAPWLESAYELDTALLEFGQKLESYDLPTELKTTDDLLLVMEGIKKHLLEELALWEYYVIDVKRDSALGIEAWKNGKGRDGLEGWKKDLGIFHKAAAVVKAGLQGAERMGERFRRRINPEAGAAFLYSQFGSPAGPQHIDSALDAYKKVLDEINLPFYKEYDADKEEILEQLYNRIKYLKLDEHGPKQGPITETSPLVETYFTRLPLNSVTEKHPKGSLYLASNGWIWNANPLVDFAGPHSRAYLRREVISWGDCVKLRYGTGPEDSPFLWEHMKTYTKLMASCFHGFRIDNCHSTPLHVAEYFLDAAREVRKDLYVVAELFTGDEKMDKMYVERLALASLIREAMQAWGTGELSRLVHRHGGRPIGSFEPESGTGLLGQGTGAGEVVKIVTGSPIHALFMDCTHDNETPAQKREAKDTLPNGALVAMCDCAVGSVYGYDEVYPKLLDVVNEKRLYSAPPPPPGVTASAVEEESAGLSGVPRIKRILNKIHEKMTREGYQEMHVHHEGEYITIHRVKPGVNKGYFLIAHTAFQGYGEKRGDIKPISLPGSKVKLIGGWHLNVKDTDKDKEVVIQANDWLTGLENDVQNLVMGDVQENYNTEEVGVVSTITVPDFFPPGSIALYETWVPGSAASNQPEGAEVYDLDSFLIAGAKEAVSKLNLVDLNFLLYKSEPEEKDISGGRDSTYNIPGFGSLVYGGLQGWWSIMEPIVEKNDLAHPLCQHLRDGTWPLGYIIGRIQREIDDNFGGEGKKERLGPVKDWFAARLERIERVPSWLRPRCFGLVVGEAYVRSVERAVDLMGGCLVEQDTPTGNTGRRSGFLRELALVGVQVTGLNKTTSLYPDRAVPCMAAGLPHFAYDYMRCWGRDIFISLRGLYLATGRYAEAKEHILAFASVLKHGMIPNLLDAGRKPRYNARDSIWFWLQCLQDYTKIAPHGIEILNETVKRRFLPYDDEWFDLSDSRAYSRSSTIAEIIQEALQRHAWGMAFREANAGQVLDSNMRWEGFFIQNGVKDWSKPFVGGGSRWNCGTWMDKNGESDIAGNKGVPGSPRDGAAVEITGLLYSTLRWVADLNRRGLYQWDSVQTSTDQRTPISFTEWADRIKANFERCYYVPLDPAEDSNHEIDQRFVLTRGIYKDLYGSSVLIGALDGDRDEGREDYRFRPNFFIAMTVAPDLFNPEHALKAIELADQELRGPIGMATLHPKDINYRPYYINSDNSRDFLVSRGRNYHQGPEWVWPTGYFLRAMLKFDIARKKTREERVETYQQITRRLVECRKHIKDSVWKGLAELTQKNGEFCPDSSPTQAWSAACLIDLFYDCDKSHQEWESRQEVS
ncbi:glucanotransferase domain of glycogen debranching enzyme-domain-containing protein [Kalaharituber pfeilii]|nr:glucanotransferase domain of glycogen debranching enzyme-domain-containing protein [Kalaharituber pfeilii]